MMYQLVFKVLMCSFGVLGCYWFFKMIDAFSLSALRSTA